MKNTSTLIIIIVIALNFTGCRKAASWLVNDNNPKHADALVILMGSMADRILQAIDLYNKGVSGKIIIVEEDMGEYRKLKDRGIRLISNSTQVYNSLISSGIPSDSITVLPGDASSTIMEALIIKDYLTNRPETDTILLVSSPSHTRRASIIFKRVFKNSGLAVETYSSPSSYRLFDTENWWKDREGIQTVMSEYVKLISFLVFERKTGSSK